MRYLKPDREIIGERVFVYRNLHRDCWSIKSVRTGRVIGYADTILLRSCTFKVSQAGRQRVLRERRKNVHAGVVGIVQELHSHEYMPKLQPVTYNPYKYETFVWRASEEPITGSNFASLDCIGKVRAG